MTTLLGNVPQHNSSRHIGPWHIGSRRNRSAFSGLGSAAFAKYVALAIAIGITAIATGCNNAARPISENGPSKRNSVDKSSQKDELNTEQPVHARLFEITQHLALAEANHFTRLSAQAAYALSKLIKKSSLRFRVYATDTRLLLIPSARHPAGSLELLLCADSGSLVVFSQDGWAYTVPLHQLRDVFERTEQSSIQLTDMRFSHDATSSIRNPNEPLMTRELVFTGHLTYTPNRRNTPPWSLRVTSTLHASLAPRDPAVPITLINMLFPILAGNTGPLLDAATSLNLDIPARWETTIFNNTYRGSSESRFVFRATDSGFVSLPSSRFAMTRPGYRQAHRLSINNATSKQLVTPAELKRIRTNSGEGTLEVENRSQAAALIYLDGLLIGWVAPGTTQTFTGPRQGFYQVFAVTPLGTRTWGPKPVYLPGPLVLR